MRPWETAAPRPWETQQPIYNRVIAIRRPQTNETPGDQGYSGTQEANESVILSGLPASIQFAGAGGEPLGGTPSDASKRGNYRIMIPASAASIGSITERDIVVDDLGKRYEVFATWPDSLGYNLHTELLEA